MSTSETDRGAADRPLPQTPDGRAAWPWTVAGLVLVVALALTGEVVQGEGVGGLKRGSCSRRRCSSLTSLVGSWRGNLRFSSLVGSRS